MHSQRSQVLLVEHWTLFLAPATTGGSSSYLGRFGCVLNRVGADGGTGDVSRGHGRANMYGSCASLPRRTTTRHVARFLFPLCCAVSLPHHRDASWCSRSAPTPPPPPPPYTLPPPTAPPPTTLHTLLPPHHTLPALHTTTFPHAAFTPPHPYHAPAAHRGTLACWPPRMAVSVTRYCSRRGANEHLGAHCLYLPAFCCFPPPVPATPSGLRWTGALPRGVRYRLQRWTDVVELHVRTIRATCPRLTHLTPATFHLPHLPFSLQPHMDLPLPCTYLPAFLVAERYRNAYDPSVCRHARSLCRAASHCLAFCMRVTVYTTAPTHLPPSATTRRSPFGIAGNTHYPPGWDSHRQAGGCAAFTTRTHLPPPTLVADSGLGRTGMSWPHTDAWAAWVVVMCLCCHLL